MQVKHRALGLRFSGYVHGTAGEDASGVFLCLVTHFLKFGGELRSETRRARGLDGEDHRN